MLLHRGSREFLGAMLFCVASAAWATTPDGSAPTTLTSTQIVDQVQRQNQVRTLELKHYQSLRHYQVEYQGFSVKLAAAMEVEVTYDAGSGKSFRIVSQSGSKVLCEKVLKRAVESEKEASQGKSSPALTPANYKFQLTGSETVGGRPAYVLDVEPVVASKFAYRGKIWVDATDFALVKIDGEPAKSPSFWLARTQIRQSFVKTGDFWLPQQNRSETKIRIGGTAVLSIDYGAYKIEPGGAS
jgi:hypothetical protein